MAGASLLALIDDIATILDDVALLTKAAAQKTAGVVGDDLALNAQQVSGIRAERELPVVWAVGVGSLKNKLILVPSALALSALAPWAVLPLLMLGGLYLCLEGVEKLAHKWLHTPAEDAAEHAAELAAVQDESVDLEAFEADKIKGAIRTDFVLSAEIIVIALGTVAGQPFATQATVLAGIGLAMTVGVYGLVAAIVKLDDVGLYLLHRPSRPAQAVGRLLLLAAPRLMKTLTVVGTAAMFLVGGSIIAHGVPALHHVIDGLTEAVTGAAGGLPGSLAGMGLNLVVGIAAGSTALVVLMAVKRLSWRAQASR